MERWGSGYVTDIPYSDGFYTYQTPQHLALTATINGIETPDLSRGFSYCELGCGRGLTSVILAAANPGGEFHAVDFNPAHIARGQTLSSAAEIPNITWHERDFASLTQSGDGQLPKFDIITMHGVWSWIAPELQNSIVQFLDQNLKPGGLLYVSYNAMPAWSQNAPLQRMIKELAAVMPGPSDSAVHGAIEMVLRLRDAKMIPDRLQPGIRQLTEIARRRKLAYLAHEYLNAHWKPQYHIDVARTLAGAKLEFVGSASLMQNFENAMLTPEQNTLLDEVPDPQIRELLKDFHLEHSFNDEVYVRGARRMHPNRRDKVLGNIKLCLMRAPPEQIEIRGPKDLVWHPNMEVYGRFCAMLAERPRSIGELLTVPGLPSNLDAVAVACLLVGGNYSAQMREPAPAAVAACRRFNAIMEDEHNDEDQIPLHQNAIIASAPLGIGVALPPGDFALYATLRRGERPDPAVLARRLDERRRAEGAFPLMEGKAVEDPAEALLVMERDYAGRIKQFIPIWRLMGIL